MNKKLLQLYGLKFNPFSPSVPTEALRRTPAVESFLWKLEHALAQEGGFALITGEPGCGKSVTLRLVAERLSSHPELVDEHTDVSLTSLYPLNKTKNAEAQRKRLEPVLKSEPPPTSCVAPLLKKLLAEYSALGLPPAYLPSEDEKR